MSEAIEGNHPPPTQFFEFAERDAQEACGFLSGDMRDSTSHPVVVRDSLHGMWDHVEGLSGSTERTMSESCLAVGSLEVLPVDQIDDDLTKGVLLRWSALGDQKGQRYEGVVGQALGAGFPVEQTVGIKEPDE